MKKIKIGNLVTYIFMAFVAFLTLVPVLYAILGSFKTNAEIMAYPEHFFPHEPTVDNFVQIFTSDEFNVGRMFINSLLYSLAYVSVAVISSTMAAYAFARGVFRGKNLIFAIFSGLLFINLGSITVYPQFEILGKLHMSASLYSLMFRNVFMINVVYIVLIKSYITTLPKELDEAARLDGCNVYGILFKIIVPLLKPIVATVTILSFQASWNDYVTPQIFTASYPMQRTLTVGIVALKNSGMGAASMNLMLAGAVISIIPVLTVYCACNKYFVSGLAAGAVKG